MEILDLKKKILNKTLPNITILTGNEVLLTIYVQKLYEQFTVLKLKSIEEYFSINSSKFNVNKDRVYLIEEDEIFKNKPAYWKIDFKNVVFIYKNLTKSSTLYKAFESNIVVFKEIDSATLKALLQSKLNIDEDSIKYLLDKCNLDYFKCVNEADKIAIFDSKEHQKLFNLFKAQNIMANQDAPNPFEFTNAVCNRQKALCISLINKIKKENIILELSSIYNALKLRLLIKYKAQTYKELGISEKQYSFINNNQKFTSEELLKALLFLSDALNKIKYGLLTNIDALNLFVLRYV